MSRSRIYSPKKGATVMRSPAGGRLTGYVDRQGALDALRLRSRSEPPWPSPSNPMLGYLRERAAEIAHDDGLDVALAWLARNAWFEGAIGERARIARLVDED